MYPMIVTFKDEHDREVITFEVADEKAADGLKAIPDGWTIESA
jgi:hypothetical protein